MYVHVNSIKGNIHTEELSFGCCCECLALAIFSYSNIFIFQAIIWFITYATSTQKSSQNLHEVDVKSLPLNSKQSSFQLRYRIKISNCKIVTLTLAIFDKREVFAQLASVVPKQNNGLMTHCHVWVLQMSIVPKCNNMSLIHCYVWVRQMAIVQLTFGVSKATFRYDRENNIFIVF